MAAARHIGIGASIVALLGCAVLSLAMKQEALPPEPGGDVAAVAPEAVAAFQPRAPARAPRDQPMRQARPAPALRVTGRGHGHGVGLSQWGAFTLGRQGSDHLSILRHFYTDVRVGSHPAAGGDIRVNLFHGVGVARPGQVQLQAAGPGVAVAVAPGAAPHAMPPGTQWTVAHDGALVLADGNGQEIDRGPGPAVVTYPAGVPALRLPQLGRGLSHGRLEISAGGGALRPVVELRLEDYLLGINEVPGDWPVEAQKAQAVAARTYAANRAAAGLRPECACHVTATVADQVYAGAARAGATLWRGAVAATTGQVVTHNGSLIQAVYSASHAGASEHGEHSWAFEGETFPYLRSVPDPWVDDPQAVADNRRSAWAHAVDHAVLADLVGLATIARVEVAERTPGGSPAVLAVSGWDWDGNRVEDARFAGTAIGVAAADLFLALRGRNAHPPSQQIDRFGFVAFPDVDGLSPHAYNIAAITQRGIATGRPGDVFAPGEPVTRAQMAAFLTRALDLASPGEDQFADVPADSPHRRAVNALGAAGIATGAGDGRYRPQAAVTRGQMATFLARAFALPAVDADHFADLAGSVHREAIVTVAEHGVAAGCDPTRFCPDAPVTRAQMASFLARAIGYGW